MKGTSHAIAEATKGKPNEKVRIAAQRTREIFNRPAAPGLCAGTRVLPSKKARARHFQLPNPPSCVFA